MLNGNEANQRIEMSQDEICKPGTNLEQVQPEQAEAVSRVPAVSDRKLPGRPGLADWLLIGLYVLCGMIFILAPVLAYSWQAMAFPGFVVEQTLVVSDYDGYNWSGRQAGIGYPQRVISLNDRAVNSIDEYQAVISSLSAGDRIDVQTITPEGIQQAYLAVPLGEFPTLDLLRLFWLPYGIGLAFLVLGIWVYRVRGMVNSGRAFAFFCGSAALANGLLFDLITTHTASSVWTLAMALQGGALVSLAFNFPEERGLFEHRRWIRYVPFLLSLALAGWGLSVLFETSQPWSYIQAWRLNYFYTAFGIVFFLGMLLYRLRSTPSQLVQQQIRVILWGGLVAFIPIGIWLMAPLFGFLIPWNPLLFLPALLFFPLSVGVAVARYRLWDLDLLINRTLVYTTLTLLLGTIYLVTVVVLQQVFINLTGQTSPLAVAVSTLGIALLFNPLRKRIQAGIDRRFFRRKYDFAQAVDSFSDTLRDEVDLDRLSDKLINLVRDTLHPVDVALCSCVGVDDHSDLPITPDDPVMPVFIQAREAIELSRLNIQSPGVHRLREKNIELVMPLVSQGEVVGLLNLGPSEADRGYSIDDRRLLSVLATRAAPTLRIAQLVQQRRQRVLADQRMEDELRVARLIQQTLLPKEMPALTGWSTYGHYQPAQAVGGDFFDFVELDGGRLGVIIGDATGKGVPAALVMAAARSYVRTAALEVSSPGLVLSKANEFLCQGMPANMFVTCLYAVIDLQNGSILFANAGHHLPCHLMPGGVDELMARGMPLGLMPGMEYEEGQANISPGESVLFYSDGLVEAHNVSREMFGIPRLKRLLREMQVDSPVVSSILEQWYAFLGDDREQEDDMTLVVLQRIAKGKSPVPRDGGISVAIQSLPELAEQP